MADKVNVHIAEDNSAEIINAMELKCKAALEACGIQAVSNAQSIITASVPRHAGSWYVPKMGSGLRGSISHKVKDEICYVGTNNEHAIYNEYGTGIYAEGGKGRKSPWSYKDNKGNWHKTRGMSALHFLRNAIRDHKTEYKKIMEQILGQ